MSTVEDLPVVVIGAGPVGLAAAARLVERGIRPLVLERGPGAGAAVDGWGHVRVFSPWAYNIDAAARGLLEAGGWLAPDPEALPTGHELVRDYLAPLAAHPAIAPHVVFGATVEAVTRAGFDKVTSVGREDAPFVVRWRDRDGAERRVEARAVIDASGTWGTPNPMGVDGLAVEGERAAGDRIAYGIPDVLGRDRTAYAGRRVLVVGGGHSAINVALDLLRLQEEAPGTRVTWALRRDRFDRLLGGGINDELPERGALGLAAKRAIEAGQIEMLAPFAAEHVAANGVGLRVTARVAGRPMTLLVDRIVVATGFRPELGMLRELRVALDPAFEAPPALAPLIDPNLHSCGTVPPHGAAELAHPEPGLLYRWREVLRAGADFPDGDRLRAGALGGSRDRRRPRRRARGAPCAARDRCLQRSAGSSGCGSGLLRRAGSGRGRRLLRARRRGEVRGQGRLRVLQRRARSRLGVTADPGAIGGSRLRTIAALGIIQILAWGSSYYLLAVLAGPIARDTGWPYAWVIAGVSLGLLLAGAVSIRVGRAIEEYGGRPVLAASALLLAAGLAVMAMAPGVPIYLAAWLLLGAGMGAGLYDAAFSTLGRLYGAQARSAITQLTLWGGFASTVCWPLSAWLVEAVGWRGACLAYAGLHLAVTLPLALFAIPREARRELVPARPDAAVLPGEAPANRALMVWLLAAILTAAGVIAAIWSVHLITILQAGGMGLASAVALGALVGPAQVGARVIEMASGGRHHPIWTLTTAAVLIAAGLMLLWAGVGLLAVALIAYGAGNGIWSIARGTLPLTLFGPQGYAVLMGRLAMPSLIAQALAPSAGALLLQRYGAQTTLAALASLALMNLVGVAALWVLARPRMTEALTTSS